MLWTFRVSRLASRVCDVAKSPARAVPDLGPPDAEAPHAWDTSGVARRFTMGDGLTYGWHRRGVPIPHVALVAVVLFAFGRITSTGGPASSAPSGLPTPTLTAHHVADDAALLNRAESAEREREQYKSLYQAREDELGAARASADDLAKQLEREAETRRALADEVRRAAASSRSARSRRRKTPPRAWMLREPSFRRARERRRPETSRSDESFPRTPSASAARRGRRRWISRC